VADRVGRRAPAPDPHKGDRTLSHPHSPRISPMWRNALATFGSIFAILAALGCALTQPSGASSGTALPTPLIAARPSPTIENTPTSLPPKVILVAPADDPALTVLKPALTSLAGEAGLEFESLQGMPSDLSGERIEVAVILAPIENLAALAESSPLIQFIAVGLAGVTPGPNLTVVGSLADRADDVAFLGGYMAALVSEDWRVASLTQSDGTIGSTSRLAFANGAVFMCGLCRPSHPPYSGYPLDYQLPSQANTQDFQFVQAQIEQDRVEVVFLQPGLRDLEMVTALTQQGVRVIGVGSPQPDSSTGWIASIEGDPAAALTAIWSDVLNGESGGSLKLPLRVDVYDATRLTPGRFELVQTTIDDLERGFIDTGVNPLTGEPE
jgi:hypothetical protein